MTEDEAKTKWCPFVRVNVGQSQCGNRYGVMANGVDSQFICIGSACMAWRWHLTGRQAVSALMEGKSEAIPTEGFCGLAGKP